MKQKVEVISNTVTAAFERAIEEFVNRPEVLHPSLTFTSVVTGDEPWYVVHTCYVTYKEA